MNRKWRIYLNNLIKKTSTNFKDLFYSQDFDSVVRPVFLRLSKSTLFLLLAYLLLVMCVIDVGNLTKNITTYSLVSTLVLLTLYSISLEKRKGVQMGSLVLFSVYYVGSIYCSINWGVGLSMSLLGFALVIMLSSVLVTARMSVILGIIVCLSVLSVGILQIFDFIIPDIHWRQSKLSWNDPIEITLVFLLIVLVAWSANRKKEKLFKKTLILTEELKNERDTLDARVKQKTKEIYQLEKDRIDTLHRFVELGKATGGLIHDLSQPLTTLNIHLSTIDPTGSNLDKASIKAIDRARMISSNINEFVSSLRKQLRGSEEKQILNLREEIISSLNLFEEKIKSIKVTASINIVNQINFFASQTLFRQIILNLIDNSLNALKKSSGMLKQIAFTAKQQDDVIELTICDSGCGIKPEYKESIFLPFFTSNKDSGTGLGLTSAQTITEKHLAGSLAIVDIPKELNFKTGTAFKLSFPSKNKFN